MKKIKLCTVRAGNVIGGGDFSDQRILPDIFRAIQNKKKLRIRMPHAIRCNMYLIQHCILFVGFNWNIIKIEWRVIKYRTNKSNVHSVNDIAFVEEQISKLKIETSKKKNKETILLTLDNKKAKKIIKWKPRFNFDKTITLTLNWYDAYLNNKNDLKKITELQIDEYLNIVKWNKFNRWKQIIK